MTTSYPLLTLDETKTAVGVRVSDATQDAAMRWLAQVATVDIETATRVKLTKQEFTELLSTRDNRQSDYNFWGSSDYYTPPTSMALDGLVTKVSPQTINLAQINIEEDEIELRYNPLATSPADFDDADALLENGKDYDVDYEKGVVTLYRGTVFRRRALRAVYTAGFKPEFDGDPSLNIRTLSPSIPDWLRVAAMIQVQFLKTKLKMDNINMAAERTALEKGKVAVSSFIHTNGLSPEAIPYLAGLKKPIVGRG